VPAMFARRIAVIGSGYVGLTTGACLASLGHRVVCADIDETKVERLRRGIVDILEPGLPELVAENQAAGRLEFVVGAREAVAGRAGEPVEVVFLCVPTPMGEGGAADLAAVRAVAAEVRHLLPAGCVVVNKSTVPVGTAEATRRLLNRRDVAVVSNPEFLREGSAVHDFLHPDRIVVGCDAQDAAERVAALYSRLGAPTVLTDAASAEMVKYAANCFLAMKLSYVNALAELCDVLGADVADVTEGMGHDRRIGQAFLQPGPGWGGSCLPKDTNALVQVAAAAGIELPLVSASIATNDRQRRIVVEKIADAVGGDLAGRAHLQGGHRRPARLARARRRAAAQGRRGGAHRLRPELPCGCPRRHRRRHRRRRAPARRQGRRRAGGAHRVARVPLAGLGCGGRCARRPSRRRLPQPARPRRAPPRGHQLGRSRPPLTCPKAEHPA
jgi:UDPglucose 6-dehydrogenase